MECREEGIDEKQIKKNLQDNSFRRMFEQKPAWNEEDKDVLEDIEEAIINYWHGDTQDIILEWLKSLKHRVQLQPRQEWSEEDENKFKIVINALIEDYEAIPELINWFKSLKERYTWKPSDEQMKALEHFVRSIGESGYASPYDNNIKLIYSLLEELKKLKDE